MILGPPRGKNIVFGMFILGDIFGLPQKNSGCATDCDYTNCLYYYLIKFNKQFKNYDYITLK